MMKTTIKRISMAALVLLGCAAGAEVKLPAYFSEHMVFQRNRPLPVWGTADPGEGVEVKFGDEVKTVAADASGNWNTAFPARSAGGPFALEVKASNRLRFDDVMVGELWLASGQSNMALRLREARNGAEEVKNSADPRLRLFSVEREWTRLPAVRGTGRWRPSSPESSADFSAVAFYFGRRLAAELGVTVGVIDGSWGGTMIEPWTVPAAFREVESLKALADQAELYDPASEAHRKMLDRQIAEFTAYASALRQAKEAKDVPPPPPAFASELRAERRDDPGVLYNGMIHPLVPAELGGVIWYQGEANRLEGMLYADKMRALISGWRTVFRNPELPFYFVQLAPFRYAGMNPVSLAMLWEAQRTAAETIPHTGMAVINDVGNLGDIHPLDKRPVGERLAGLALKRTFGKDVPAEFPVPVSFRVDGSRVRIVFGNADGLRTRDGKAPTYFELCGKDGVFHPAAATLDGSAVVLTAPEVPAPVAARFAWRIDAEPNLVNGAGLPAGAFRLGDLPRLNPIQDDVAESQGYQLIYDYAPLAGKDGLCRADRSGEFANRALDRVAYYLEFEEKDGRKSWIWIDAAPFTAKCGELGLPADRIFQQDLKDAFVAASPNLRSIARGRFADGCGMEFWPNNYRPDDARKLPGASGTRCDFSDTPAGNVPAPGYGSMQLHNHARRQTLFAWNNWKAGAECDLGIGSRDTGHPDWTGSKSGAALKNARLLVLAKFKE